MPDPLLERLIPPFADVPGVVAIVLGGSRARGTARPASDYDIGLYHGPDVQLDTDRLLEVVRGLVDDPGAAAVTPVHDPLGMIAGLKAMTSPYPKPLREAIIRRFQWEVLFSIENGEIAVSRREQTHIAVALTGRCAALARCCSPAMGGI